MGIYIPDLNIPIGENELVVCSDKQVYIREPDNYQSYSMRNSGVKAVDCTEMRPVKYGKWTLNKDGSATCSECHRTQQGTWDLDNWDNFCHFCGADMR